MMALNHIDGFISITDQKGSFLFIKLHNRTDSLEKVTLQGCGRKDQTRSSNKYRP